MPLNVDYIVKTLFFVDSQLDGWRNVSGGNHADRMGLDVTEPIFESNCPVFYCHYPSILYVSTRSLRPSQHYHNTISTLLPLPSYAAAPSLPKNVFWNSSKLYYMYATKQKKKTKKNRMIGLNEIIFGSGLLNLSEFPLDNLCISLDVEVADSQIGNHPVHWQLPEVSSVVSLHTVDLSHKNSILVAHRIVEVIAHGSKHGHKGVHAFSHADLVCMLAVALGGDLEDDSHEFCHEKIYIISWFWWSSLKLQQYQNKT